MTVASVVVAEIHELPLVAPAFVFPIIAIGFFALLGAVAWSYRDVARRHADRVSNDAPRGH